MPASPLEMVRCSSCGLLQLRHTTNPSLLYSRYWYRSGVNATMRAALADIAGAVEARVALQPGDLVIDIGSNDGTLLNSYAGKGLRLVGFEPSDVGVEAQRQYPNVTVIRDYFGRRDDLLGKARVVTSVAMFYDLDDPDKFIKDVAACLRPDGLWILQLAYLPSILERTGFDGICHEHLCYYSLHTLEPILGRNGFFVEDADLIDLNEGTIRLYLRRSEATASGFVDKLRQEEAVLGLDRKKVYLEFAARVEQIKKRVRRLLRSAVAGGETVHAYGASTKGNTLLQYFGLNRKTISAVWERQEQKWGRETVATRIPIISEAEGRRRKPDWLLMLPWHFAPEFVERESEYLAGGGHFVVPLPQLRIVSSPLGEARGFFSGRPVVVATS